MKGFVFEMETQCVFCGAQNEALSNVLFR